MRGFSRWAALRAALAIAACTLLGFTVVAYAAGTTTGTNAGREIAFNVKKGNCLACHWIQNGESPGNIGPPLITIQSRYANKEKLRKVIWDRESLNPDTVMPPFGKNRILTRSEIDKLVDFIWTL